MDKFTSTSLSNQDLASGDLASGDLASRKASASPQDAPARRLQPGFRARLDHAKQSGLVRKAARFGIVGVVSSLFYVATMAALVEGLRTSATVGAIGAFCVGTAVSYVGNTVWSFEAQWDASSARKFLVVTLAGLGLNVAIAYALESVGLHYLLIALVILVTVPAFNFIGHNLWTYRNAA